MTGLLLLLLAEVSAPLGPYARPGVPVLLVTKGETELVIEGWRYKAEPLTIVHPPFLPCTVHNAEGKELLRLEQVPPRKLIGTTGSGFDLEGGPMQVHIEVAMFPGVYWRCLDVFDEVVGTAPMIDAWKRAGGDREIPRVGNIAPDVYDLVDMPVGASPAWGTARLVIVVTSVVLGALVLLRAHLGLIALVAVFGAAAGLLAPRAEFDAEVATELEILYHLPGSTRRRVFTAHTAVAGNAHVTPHPQSVPLFYRAAADPWWNGVDRSCALEPGVIRLFLTEEIQTASRGPEGGEGPMGKLVEAFRPKRGRWRVGISAGKLEFTAVD